MPAALVGSLVITTLAGFVPARLDAVARVASASAAVDVQAKAMGIENGVMFGMSPHRPCRSRPTHSWVYWPPANDPGLTNDLLWVNHVNVEDDRLFMRHVFPGRQGYWYLWNGACELMIGSLDDPAAASLPPNPRLPAGYRVAFE
jgi:hypothetical protein